MNNTTFRHVQDSIVACRNLHGISATDESEVYAFRVYVPSLVARDFVTRSEVSLCHVM